MKQRDEVSNGQGSFNKFFNRNIFDLSSEGIRKNAKYNPGLVFRLSFYKTYPYSGLGTDSAPNAFLMSQPLIAITSFFNFPNQTKGGLFEKLTFAQLGKNFIGWNDKSSTLANFLRPLIFIPLNITRVVLGTALNTVKIVTEFLPRLLENETKLAAYKLLYRITDKKRPLSTFWRITGELVFESILTAHIAFKTVRLLGSAITSPVNNLKAARDAGEDLGGKKGTVLTGVLGTLSGAISTLPFVALLILGTVGTLSIIGSASVLLGGAKDINKEISYQESSRGNTSRQDIDDYVSSDSESFSEEEDIEKDLEPSHFVEIVSEKMQGVGVNQEDAIKALGNEKRGSVGVNFGKEKKGGSPVIGEQEKIQPVPGNPKNF